MNINMEFKFIQIKCHVIFLMGKNIDDFLKLVSPELQG